MSDELENRLAWLRPRALSPTLTQRIASDLERESAPVRGDRFFWPAVAGGAIAACVIVAVLLSEPSRSVPGPAIVDDPTVKNSLTALARADRRSGDELTLASDWSHP
jgi:hypothetical protein